MTNLRILFLGLSGCIILSCSPGDDTGQPIPDVDLSATAFRSDEHVNTSELPQNVLDYIVENYSGMTIKDAEKEENGNLEVELFDGTELIFDATGNFLGIDNDTEDLFGDERFQISSLPSGIRSFLGIYFSGVTIKDAQLENNGNYEVELSNGLEIVFDNSGEFLGMAQDRLGNSDRDDRDIVPTALPEIIRRYIEANYPQQVIIEAEEENNGTFEVNLNDGTELKFDANGKFLGAQDNNEEED